MSYVALPFRVQFRAEPERPEKRKSDDTGDHVNPKNLEGEREPGEVRRACQLGHEESGQGLAERRQDGAQAHRETGDDDELDLHLFLDRESRRDFGQKDGGQNDRDDA